MDRQTELSKMRKYLKCGFFITSFTVGLLFWIYLAQTTMQILSNQQEMIIRPSPADRKMDIHDEIIHTNNQLIKMNDQKSLADELNEILMENEYIEKDFDPRKYSVLHPLTENTPNQKENATENSLNYIPFRSKITDNDFQLMLSPKKDMCSKSTIVVIAVSCSVESFHYRQAIRETWGSVINNPNMFVSVVFNLAKPLDKWLHLQEEIRIESHIYQDIIQWDFYDSAENLTLKTIGLFKWFLRDCPNAKFLMKTDDDVFINIPNLLQILTESFETNQHNDIMLGYIIKKAKPGQDRNSKWFTSKAIFKDHFYPDYLSGSAYIISQNQVLKLYKSALQTPPFWLEDVFITGVLRKRTEATLIHNSNFWFRKRKGGPCEYKVIVAGHELSAEELYKIWNHLQRTDLDCSGFIKRYGSLS